MSNNFKIPLEAAVDQHGATYYIARLKAPLLIDCKDGVVFLVFNSAEGEEELQISSYKKPSANNHSEHKKPEVIRQ